MWRIVALTMVLVSFPFVAVAHAQTAPAPVMDESIDLGAANVRIEMYGWEEADRRFTPAAGLASGDGSMHEQMISGRYQMALEGRWPAGSREVLGFVGGPYPNDADLKVVGFSRKGSAIEIALRRFDTGGKGDGYRSWKVAYVSAMLPGDLPEGTYAVKCVVSDASGAADSMTRGAAQCEVIVPNPKQAEMAEQREALKKLGDEQLAREYIAAAKALGTGPLAPREVPIRDLPAFEYNDVKYLHFVDVGEEIVRRGKPMVQWLMAMVQRYVPATAGSRDPHPIGLARAVMELMARIGEPKSAPLLVEVLGGMDGKAIAAVRQAAMEALERLTMTTFRRQTLVDGRQRWCVEDARALPSDARDPIFGATGPAGQAAAFKAWLEGEGKDSAQWGELARQRAREALAGKDLRGVYAAVEFLQGEDAGKPRDDQPAATMQRMGEILAAARQVGVRAGNYEYQFQGQVLPLTINDWIDRLAQYGTRARPHAKALVRIDEEITAPSARRIKAMTSIGGEETVAYLVRRLPELEKRLAAADADAKSFPDPLTEQRLAQVTQAAQAANWALARWTGHAFASSAEMTAWWEDNADKGQGQWLREGLTDTASRADAGDPIAMHLMEVLVPDAPKSDRAAWLKSNHVYLAYDERAGCFRVDRNAFP